ncbi:uncharacterized protein LOC127755818 [Oryza glaberrima]|uniref:uncharacterized protein LOC127755818 n=1 Tax=Oryza glaberrima TaxID=4538 RepID=UPI00224BF69A|nr:uncharacterized protein LOC127755818 [Oryza glaberrima]
MRVTLDGSYGMPSSVSHPAVTQKKNLSRNPSLSSHLILILYYRLILIHLKFSTTPPLSLSLSTLSLFIDLCRRRHRRRRVRGSRRGDRRPPLRPLRLSRLFSGSSGAAPSIVHRRGPEAEAAASFAHLRRSPSLCRPVVSSFTHRLLRPPPTVTTTPPPRQIRVAASFPPAPRQIRVASSFPPPPRQIQVAAAFAPLPDRRAPRPPSPDCWVSDLASTRLGDTDPPARRRRLFLQRQWRGGLNGARRLDAAVRRARRRAAARRRINEKYDFLHSWRGINMSRKGGRTEKVHP